MTPSRDDERGVSGCGVKFRADAAEQVRQASAQGRCGKDDADGGEAKKEALDSAKQEGYQSGLEAAADALLEEAAGESATLEDEGGTGDSVADLSSDDGVDVYNFFNVLAGVKSLPEPDDFISVIPASRRDDVTEDLTTAVEWINRFSTLWEIENEDTEY